MRIAILPLLLLLLLAAVPLQAQTPIIDATKQDSVRDVNAPAGANSGDSILYRVTIRNTGSGAATDVILRDTLDSKLTLDPNSINTSPIAINDTFATTGNVLLTVGAPGVLPNDFDADGVGPAFSVSAGATSTNGGNVSMSANGSFTYNPPPGFTGTDSFLYTLSDGEGFTDTARIYVTVTGIIWFIDNNVASNGDGRLSSPFKLMSDFSSVNDGGAGHPKAGDKIFVYETSGLYNSPATLLNDQWLIGQDATSSLSALTGLTANSSAFPAMNSGNGTSTRIYAGSGGPGNDVNIAQRNRIYGLTLGNAETVISGTNFDTLTVGDVIVSTNGSGINLNNGVLAGSFTSYSTAGDYGAMLNNVNSTGTVSFSNSGTITSTTYAFVVSGGNVSFNYGGTITMPSGGISIGQHTGTVTMNGPISISGGFGLDFGNADGTYNFNGTTTLSGGDARINIASGSSGTFTFGSGTSVSNPGSSLPCFNVNGSSPNVTFSGTLTRSGTSAGLLAQIVNQPSGAITFQTGTLSSTSSAGTGITLSNADGTVNFNSPVTLNGGDAGIDIVTSSNGTFTFANCSVTNGIGRGLTITSSGPTINYTGSITTTAGPAIDANVTGGSLTFGAGSTVSASVTSVGLAGVVINPSGNIFNATFQDVTLSSTNNNDALLVLSNFASSSTVNFNGVMSIPVSHNTGIQLANGGGTFNFNNTGNSIVGAGNRPFRIIGGSMNVVYNGNISQPNGGALIDITNGHTGTVTFQNGTLSASSGSGLQFNDADGIYSFNGTVTLNGGSAGIDIINGSSGIFAFSSNTSITNPSGDAFEITGSNCNVSYSGSISDNGGYAVDIDNHDAGAATFQTGSITSTGTGLRVMNSNGGTVTFSGPSKTLTTGGTAAVDLTTNNGGGTVNFTNGGLVISTTTGIGFNATGGGTVNVTGSGNTINSASAIALNVSSTTIGSSNLNFQSISSGNSDAAADPVNGIVLNNTGTSGGLIVTGTAAAGSGGTIRSTTGSGILLTNTRNISLNRMAIRRTALNGIEGTQVHNFTFANGVIDSSGTASVAGGRESNVFFAKSSVGNETNITGLLRIAGSTLTNAYYSGLNLTNHSGTVDTLDISRNTITSYLSNTQSFGSGIDINVMDSAATIGSITRATIDSNTVRNFPSGSGIVLNGGNRRLSGTGGSFGTPASSDTFRITRNIVSGQSSTAQFARHGILVWLDGILQGNILINNNTVSHSTLETVAFRMFGHAKAHARITNNTINANNTAGTSALAISCDSNLTNASTGAHLTAIVNNNSVSNSNGNSIMAYVRNSRDTMRLTLVGNNAAAPIGTGVRSGIRVDAGSTNGNANVCLKIEDNTSAFADLGTDGIQIRKQGTSTTVNAFGVDGWNPATQTVEQYIEAQNPSGNGVLLVSATTGFTTCTAP